MSYDFAQERYEASLADYGPDIDPSDVDDTPDRRPQYACCDRLCGCLDCATCFPASFEAEDA